MKRGADRTIWSKTARVLVPTALAPTLVAAIVAAIVVAGSLKPAPAHANPAKIWVINDNVASSLKGSPITWTAAGLTASDISSLDAWQTASGGKIGAWVGAAYIVVQTDGSTTSVRLNGRGLLCQSVVPTPPTNTPTATHTVTVLPTSTAATPIPTSTSTASGPACDGVATATPVGIPTASPVGEFAIWPITSVGSFVSGNTVTAIQDAVTLDSMVLTVVVAGAPSTFTLAAQPASITCDGTNASAVSATVRDYFGTLVPDGTPVNFSVVALGTADPINTVTATGIASTTVLPFKGAIGVTVIVTSGDVQKSIGVLCDYPPPPAIPHAASGGTTTTLKATLTGAMANTVYRIDLFSALTCGAISGGTFVGAFAASSDRDGSLTFTEMLSIPVPAAQFLQATVTDPYNYTSPVSACQSVVARACTDDTTCNGYTDAQKIALGKDPFTYCAIMRADVNMDGKVSLADLVLTAGWFNQAIPPAPARDDQNADGKISLADLVLEATNFNQSVTACP